MNKKKSIIWKIDKKTFIDLINSSNSISEIMTKLNLKVHGGNFRTFYKRVEEEKIDISGLTDRASSKINNNLRVINTIPLKDILVKNSTYINTSNLKKRLLNSSLLKNECYVCGIGPFWNNIPLTLQLDHINGINNDNRISNLRIICPNCHTQTITYVGKNRKKKKSFCTSCNLPINKSSNYCVKCVQKNNRVNSVNVRKVSRPNRRELIELILNKSFTQIAKEYDVSDNAIRKWCKFEKLPFRRSEIIEQKNYLLLELTNNT